ncbi:hypothetical protein JTB14_008285 [Gonioctena quinquepunctata]|nr:hypothetical protein JTB14_008285 [Gonioctena quinquepunctata]
MAAHTTKSSIVQNKQHVQERKATTEHGEWGTQNQRLLATRKGKAVTRELVWPTKSTRRGVQDDYSTQIGTEKLMFIARGLVKIDKCPHLCFVNTINWKEIGAGGIHFTNSNNGTCEACPPRCKGESVNKNVHMV